MTYLEAAITVLEDARRPLTTAEIAEHIARSGLITASGRTPKATLSAALYRSVGKRSQLRREAEPGPRRAKRGTVRWSVAQ
jgi:hypothetical protein